MSLPDNYSAASGQVITLGRAAVSTVPAWMAGKPLNEWFEIPGTSGADGTLIDAFCGMALKQSTAEILIALAGGHQNGYDTRVSSISLLADAPSWKTPRRKESITADLANYSQHPNYYPYCKDGVTPSSRHTRYTMLHSPQDDRIMMLGSPSLYGAGGESSNESNGFSLATNTWDPPGTWPSVGTNYYTAGGGASPQYGMAIDDIGNIWCTKSKWIRATNSVVAMSSQFNNCVVFDPVRRQLFGMWLGGGTTPLPTSVWTIKTISEDLTTVRNITFSSAAWDEYKTYLSHECAITYDPIKDVFYYYCGYSFAQGVVYVITPNSGTVWGFEKLVQGPGTIMPAHPSPDVNDPTNNTKGAGIQNRFQYVTALKGIVMLAHKTANLYFMRTS